MKKDLNSEYIKNRRKKIHAFYKSKEWQQVREYVLMRDKYLCKLCGRPAEHVHHIKHLSEDNVNDTAISLNPDNLISLCKRCHDNEHKGEHGRGRVVKESYEYEFDSNGMLIPKKEYTPL